MIDTKIDVCSLKQYLPIYLGIYFVYVRIRNDFVNTITRQYLHVATTFFKVHTLFF